MNSLSNIKIAICQPHIILGGRLQVILAIAHVLNEMGIVPDIVTFSCLGFDPSDIEKNYQRSVKVNFKLVKPRPVAKSQDISILLYNAMLNIFGKKYDLLINSSNSLVFLPENKRILHYVHFPRKARFYSKYPDIHQPELQYNFFSTRNILHHFFREAYRMSKIYNSHNYVCNSEFTYSALSNTYGEFPLQKTIIYPPVNLAEYYISSDSYRKQGLVTLGRFGPAKGQLEQIKLAERLPHIPFHIVGFVGDKAYYKHCTAYIKEKQLTNVHLHPNAKYEEMVLLLKQSKYFLHTLVNEPFGITAVQAIGAGCIPIVHDSGGQRETVPEEFLRYKELDQIPAILKHVESLGESVVDELNHRLLKHARRNFDETIFHTKMKKLLTSTLSVL